jgi:outer membrane protein OmpA-like peptidoglycan-associated protein/tetratricopeptide (TPR) repeat protein
MKKLILLVLLLITGNSFSQAELKKADRLYSSHAYLDATQIYNNYIEENNNISAETYLNAADANYFINNMRQASMYYEKAFNANSVMEEPYLSRYLRSLRSVRDYKKADRIYIDYLKKSGDTDAVEKFNKEVAAFNLILENKEPSRYSVINLDINTKYSDFVNVIHGDDVIFSSSRPGASKELYAWNDQPYLSQYIAKKTETGQLADATLFGQQISSSFHDATIAFMPNSDIVYYTSSAIKKNRLLLDEGRNNNFSIYKGRFTDGKITGKEAVFFNSSEYSTGHPSISSDGKYLFFASNMPGGFGEADIYYCEIFEDGKLSTPKNAGDKINTSGNDFFPFLIDGELYFSSNGHLGFGGIDIFSAVFDEETQEFSEAINLGKVVNTSDDDFAIVFNKDNTSGYLSSNREGGKGDDDIYFFYRKPLSCDQFITGTAKDKLSKEFIADVIIAVKDSTNTTLQTVRTNQNGSYEVKIPCNTPVTLTAKKEGYIEKSEKATTGMVDGEYTPKVNFELNKYEDIIVKDDKGIEKIKMDAIYFEYNKWNITPAAAIVLDKAAEVMKDIPDMTIKIEAHTDSRGSAAYNLSLSDKRAKATQEYLYSQGISQDRIISAIGYGESRLLNHCSDSVKCSDKEHDVNRRSDFIILKR